jgi:hypothetical protein
MNAPNPYAPPASDALAPAEAPASEAAPPFKLYTPGQAALATFLGTPLAGLYLVYANRRRLKDERAGTALALGVGATVALFTAAFLLPEAIGRVIPLASLLGVRWYAARDRPQLEEHLRRGGKKESGWKAAGIGVVTAVVALALAVGAFVLVELVTGKDL